MRDVEWRQAARDDLRSIFDYIAEHSPPAALALLAQIETRISRLPDRPKAYRVGRVAGTREMVVRPNYLVNGGVKTCHGAVQKSATLARG